MTVNFQYVNTDVSETLSRFTTEKLEKLANKFEFIISSPSGFKGTGSTLVMIPFLANIYDPS